MSDEQKIDDGGPAFPFQVPNPEKHPHGYAVNGMSLRQWYAGQALAGMAAKFEEGMAAIIDGPDPSAERLRKTAARFAAMVFATADAMIVASGRKGN